MDEAAEDEARSEQPLFALSVCGRYDDAAALLSPHCVSAWREGGWGGGREGEGRRREGGRERGSEGGIEGGGWDRGRKGARE